MGVLRDTCRSTPHLVSVLLLVVSARAGLPGTCLTELTTARSALCCKPQSFIELSFKLRLGCDVPVYLDQGIRLEVRRSQEETFQPIRFYAAGTQNRSDSPVTLTTAVSNQVSAEALNYASIFPLEVVNSSEPVTFREYICGESFQTEGVDIRWMQRYSGDSESDVATWSLEDITISIWDGQCCQVIFKQEDEVLSDEVYAIVKGNVTIPPCSLSGNKELYFNQKSNNRRRPRRSLTLTNLNLTSPEADCESIPLSNSSICDVNSCGVNIDICSIGSIECAGCYGDDLLVPSSGMLGSCIGQCLELPPIENGIIAYDVEFGQEATYLCSPGYFRVGVMVRNCTVIDNEGIWSTQPPNCCSPLDLDKIVNLTVRIDTYEDITALVSIFATLSVGNTQLQTVENLRKLSTIVKGVANFVVISDRPISSVMVGNLLNILNSLLQWDSDGLDTESSSSIVESFEDVGARFAQQGELLNSTLSDLSFLTDVVQVQQFLEDNESLNYSPEKDVSASISLPPSLFGQLPDGTNTTGVLFTLYERPDLFSVFDGPVSESKRSTRVIDSLVIGAVAGVDMDFANIDPPVQITLVLLNPQNVSRGSEECVSWNFITNSWTGDGCTTERDGDTVTCQCSHLTNFAVLVDVCLRAQDCMTDPVTQKVLSVITYAGVTVSCFGLIVTVITLLAFKWSLGTKLRLGYNYCCLFPLHWLGVSKSA